MSHGLQPKIKPKFNAAPKQRRRRLKTEKVLRIILRTKNMNNASEALESDAQTQKNPVKDWDSNNGAKETRTPDPLHAMQVLYQLSYGPMVDGFAFQAWLST